jgi:hypothetical protein
MFIKAMRIGVVGSRELNKTMPWSVLRNVTEKIWRGFCVPEDAEASRPSRGQHGVADALPHRWGDARCRQPEQKRLESPLIEPRQSQPVAVVGAIVMFRHQSTSKAAWEEK